MGNLVVVREKAAKFALFQKKKSTLANKEGPDTYKIREVLHLDCNSENVIYLITCKKCKKQYVGSCITRFCTRFNNYRSHRYIGSFVGAIHRKFCRSHSVIQVSFHARFMLDGHCVIDNWEVILIDKERNKQETRHICTAWSQ